MIGEERRGGKGIVAFVGECRVADAEGIVETEDTSAIGNLVQAFNS